MSDPEAVYERIRSEVSQVLVGKDPLVEALTVSMLTRGHILLEGVPGVAKTTLANLFARATGLDYNRIQMTPDVLPADITGTYIYREQTGEFQLQRGPVFANVVVADEINRATPKTQSALLEAMQERTVTIEGETLALPTPFMVIATQNPVEMSGTFELPKAQRDRFQFKLTVDLPDREEEAELLDRFDRDPEFDAREIERVVTPGELAEARQAVADVYVDDTIREYILDIVAATRENASVEYGASPRAGIDFLNAAKARAAIDGRDYVVPDDVKRLAHPVLNHRLVLSTDAELGDVPVADVIEDVLGSVASPSRAVVERAVADGGDPDVNGSGA